MPFDLSRVRFEARQDFLGVIMQQGRVQLDADWNEWVAQLGRRIQAGSFDTYGQAVVPRETTPDGFLIEAVGGALQISPGRIYVDGLLAENHGAAPDAWNPHLAELGGTAPVDYLAQPYLPEPPALPESAGPHLVYVDVWQREVSHLEEPGLVEQAVGVDSTGRLQTVWQVKVLPDVGNIDCATDDADIPDWPETIAPSGGRLSTGTADPPDEPDPCEVPPSAGYLGLENQLYRVEVHQGGDRTTATFKWSRDNATVATTVTHINPARDRLTVGSIGRDDVLRFNDGDWVEVTDDVRELAGEPGELRRIRLNDGVDPATNTIELESPLSVDVFPVDAQEATEPTRHTRIKRWDQSGQVREQDGTSHIDLDLAGSTGDIPLPAVDTRLFLEHGIVVEFDLDPAGGEFKSGDYWVFAARSVDASVEILEDAPPRGIHHHYAKLAIVTLPDAETDCRTLWPPLSQGESCDCTVCVHPEEHNAGTATIQQAVDQIAAVGGTICLAAGTYQIREPIQIDGAQSIRIRGQGWHTILIGEVPGTILEVTSSVGVAIENVSLLGSVTEKEATPTLRAHNVVDLVLEHSNVVAVAVTGATSTAIELSGYLLGFAMTNCAVVAERGVASSPEQESALLTGHLHARDNVLLCADRGFSFDAISLHFGACTIEQNLILGCNQAGVVATGGVLTGSSFTISRNVFYASGDGVRAGVDGLRIDENEITHVSTGEDHGIVLEPGLDPVGIDHVRIIGNRIQRMPGHGIAIRHRVDHGMIKQNTIADVGGGAVVMEEGGSASHLVIENNHFLNLGVGFDDQSASYAAVQLISVDQMDFVNNVFEQIAREALATPVVSGVLTGAVLELRASGNRMIGVGPDRVSGMASGFRCIVPFGHLAIDDNTVSRVGTDTPKLIVAAWQAVQVDAGIARTTIGAEPLTNFSTTRATTGAVFLPSRTFAYFAMADDAAVLLTATTARAIAVTSGAASLRGNRFRGELTATPIVHVEGVESCLFADNHCRTSGESADRVTPVVELQGNVVNASNNRLIGAVDLETLRIVNSGGRGVVIGNMTTGNITVDGGGVPAPYDKLNVFGV